MSRFQLLNVQKFNKEAGGGKMRTAKALMAVAAVAAVLGWASMASAVTFTVEVQVGWVNSTGTCTGGGSTCLGFAGAGGFGAGTSTRLNWDNATAGPDSYLSIGALPDVIGFPPAIVTNPVAPTGIAFTTIDPGQTVRTAQIRHTNNDIDNTSFLANIDLRTLLTITAPGGTVVIGDGTGGDLTVPVTFLETNNHPLSGVCSETSNSLGSTCDDQFTFFRLDADIPFSFGGQSYILHVAGLLNPNNTPACEDAGGGNVNCLTRENEINDRFVAITLELVRTPAPASLLLVGLGLLGAGVLPIIRKRRSA
jgi:hypothetical protein